MIIIEPDGTLLDSTCRVDLWGHDIDKLAPGKFRCAACDSPARFHWETDLWVVVRPFTIYEEPW